MQVSNHSRQIMILMADDDPEDRMLAKDALEEHRLSNHLEFVEDGEELMDYLHRRGQYSELIDSPLPGLILLDLNMPRKDGREALAEIKADPNLKRIPIAVLTTSKAEEDILRTYELGVSGFVVKPVRLDGLVHVMKSLVQYWFEIVELSSDAIAA